MDNKKLNKKRIINHYIAIPAQIILFVAILFTIHSNFLWFDESGQFYLSQGLDFFSNNDNHKGTINDSIILSNKYNLDPPGFTILLKYWSKISTHILWLRILPILFYVLFGLSFCYIFYLLFKKNELYTLSGFIVLFTPQLIIKSIELRAYSMEASGTAISILVLIFLDKKITNKRLLFCSIVLSFFTMARYSLLLTIFIHTLLVIRFLLKDGTFTKKNFIQIIIYCSPLVLTTIVITLVSLLNQLKNMKIIDYDYMDYLSKNPMVLFEYKNLIYIILMLIIFIFYLKKKNEIKSNFKVILEYTILANLFFIFISFLGLHPWSLFSPPRGNTILILTIVSSIGMMIHSYGKKIEELINYTSMSLIIIICFLYLLVLDIKMENNWRTVNIISDLKKIEFDRSIVLDDKKKIVVDFNSYISLKYLIQYGIFSKNYKYDLDDFLYEGNFQKDDKLIPYLYLSTKDDISIKKLPGYNFLFLIKKSNDLK